MLDKKHKNFQWQIIKKLSNLNLSITILLLIAFISLLGTVIEQDKTLEYYKLNYPIDNSKILINWKIIILLGLNKIYINWWFISLLVFFFCTLIACTFSRQLPGLNNARNWKFASYSHIDEYNKIWISNNIENLSNIIYELNISDYYTFHKNNSLYSYKGIAGRIAPIFVHISIIITLIGSVLGLFSGFTAQQIIPNHEIFHIQNIIKSGYASNLPHNILGRIDNFTIQYNEDESIQQFYSSISLLNNQTKSLTKKKISVNTPLIFNGLTFYQTDWQITGLRIKANDDYYIQQKLQNITIAGTPFWAYKLPINTTSSITLIIKNLRNEIFLYDQFGQFINIIRIHEKFYINKVPITIEEIMTKTGIQIKTDPGILYVYTGFMILIISIIISYISYSQIWIYNHKQQLEFKGTTNRSKLNFEEEVTKIQRNICKYL